MGLLNIILLIVAALTLTAMFILEKRCKNKENTNFRHGLDEGSIFKLKDNTVHQVLTMVDDMIVYQYGGKTLMIHKNETYPIEYNTAWYE
jgi:uncharacterized protein YkvS